MRTRSTRRRARGRGHTGLACPEARPLISAVLDGEADDLIRARVERHVRSCGPCREFLELSRRAGVVARGRRSHRPGPALDPALTAADLAVVLRGSRSRPRRPDSWRSVTVGAALTAAISLGAVLGGLGVWTLVQDPGGAEEVVADVALPRITAPRTLDPGTAVEPGPVSILTAWVPPRPVENTFDEKAMFWVTPMSHYERVHFLPEGL